MCSKPSDQSGRVGATGVLASKMIAMNPKPFLVLLCTSLCAAAPVHGKTVLPDACGDDSVKFNVKTQNDAPVPAPPAAGKAQIVFIETSTNPHGCFATFTSCTATARFGVDGAWVGATTGNSYFALSVDPGEHHLCATMGKDIGVEALTVEAGKVYYYQALFDVETSQLGNSQHPHLQVKKAGSFSILKEDEGKFRVKASPLATWTTGK